MISKTVYRMWCCEGSDSDRSRMLTGTHEGCGAGWTAAPDEEDGAGTGARAAGLLIGATAGAGAGAGTPAASKH